MPQGVRRFLVINGHGGNNSSIDRASMEVYRSGGIFACIDWWSAAGELDGRFRGGHGDGFETSVMMAICPQSVNLKYGQRRNEQIRGGTSGNAGTAPSYFSYLFYNSSSLRTDTSNALRMA